jgi:CBS domain containing-hemolysin-like protein
MSLNSAVMHDEAIGIITMEDLMEELLQVSIVL